MMSEVGGGGSVSSRAMIAYDGGYICNGEVMNEYVGVTSGCGEICHRPPPTGHGEVIIGHRRPVMARLSSASKKWGSPAATKQGVAKFIIIIIIIPAPRRLISSAAHHVPRHALKRTHPGPDGVSDLPTHEPGRSAPMPSIWS